MVWNVSSETSQNVPWTRLASVPDFVRVVWFAATAGVLRLRRWRFIRFQSIDC